MTPARIHQLRLRHTLDAIDTIAKRGDLRSVDRRRLALTLDRITWLHAHLPRALDALADAQPGYPTGDSARTGGTHSDRTGELATTTRTDPARAALDALELALHTIRSELHRAATTHHSDDARKALTAAWLAAADAERITRTWQPPNHKWRTALATEAAAEFDGHNLCAAHLRLGEKVETRRPKGRLCRTCEGVARDLNLHDPPEWIIANAIARGHVSSDDLDAARCNIKLRRKAKTRR